MKKPLRQRIREVTDALPAGEWLRARDILKRMPRPKPPAVGHITAEVKTMCGLLYLERRGAHRPYEYRSGPEPIVDHRRLRRGVPQRELHHLGFAALARLEREDPKAWARETANDVGFRHEGGNAG